MNEIDDRRVGAPVWELFGQPTPEPQPAAPRGRIGERLDDDHPVGVVIAIELDFDDREPAGGLYVDQFDVAVNE